MLSPEVQRLAFLLVVSCAVIDTGDAGLVAGDVIEHSLDNVRLYAQLGHARGDGASQVVHCPMFSLGAAIKFALGGTPSGEPGILSSAKYTHTVWPAMKPRQYGLSRLA